MAVKINSKRSGKPVTLLNPREKGTKAFDELTNGVKLTNDGHLKMDKFNRPIPLTDEERAYRAGYLQAQKDGRKCYNAKQRKKKRQTK